MSEKEMKKARSKVLKALVAADKARTTLDQCKQGSAEWLEARDWLLTSPQATLAAAITYAFGEEKDRPSLEACLECAAELDLNQPILEDVTVYPKKKAGKTGWRPIANFGLQHRTAQHMVKPILDSVFKPRPFQYSHRGVQLAIRAIRKHVAQGRVWVAT